MKRELYMPVIIVAVTLVFGVICLMVYLSNGIAYWIKKKLKIGALLLTFNGIVYGTSGQASCYIGPDYMEPSSYGVSFGISNINHITPNVNSNEITDNIRLYDSYETGYFLGLSYEYDLENPHESLSSIIFHLRYDNKPGKVNQFIIPQSNNPIKGETIEFTKIKIDYSFSFITAEILYKQKFFINVPIGIILGPYFSIPIELNANETLYNRVYQNDSINISHEEKKIYNDKIKNARPIDIGMVAGIQYEIIFGMNIFIVPSVTYRFSLTGIQYETDWNITSFDFGISIRCRF